jgi:hypothetical protein
MAHFAQIGSDNIVLQVLAVSNDDEHRGQEFLADDLGFGGTWIQTSYWVHGGVHYGEDGEPDGGIPLHLNFAGIGFSWDGIGFAAPQPYPSWVLSDGYEWEPPTPRTNDGYIWDEDTTSWVKPDSPYPSWVWSDEHAMWMAPVPYPGVLTEDGPQAPVYVWDEDTTSWVEITE